MFLLLVSVASACEPFVVPSLPAWPWEDGTIVNPRGNDRVVTRETNSELVDLGWPGPIGSQDLVNCPYDEPDLEHWTDVVPTPASGARVELPENKKILISQCDVTVPLGQLVVPSTTELIFADEPIDLSVTGFEVYGKLRIGSETCRLRSYQSITLRGSRPQDNLNGPSAAFKGIYVFYGELDIHSVEYYHTWSRLAVTAEPGDTYILMQDIVNWDEGSKIFLAGTQLKDARDWHQNEEFTVVKVRKASHLGSGVVAVYLDTPVKYTHYGGDEYQAEVGLLSRRFKIQGDEDSEPTDTTPLACSNSEYASFPCPETYLTGYGGHLMIEGQWSAARVAGVEFYRLGQTNFEGRYPIHWHLVKDSGDGQYVTDSSFHRSYYKCVTLHGTNKVLASRNVAYDVIGHCLYLEDGVEEENIIEYNLHAHIHPIGMPPGDGGGSQYLPDIHNSASLVTASDATASGFYIPNAYNIIRGNAAVGGYSGFQFPIFPSPIKEHRDVQISPRQRPTLIFDGNSCHSSGHWWGHAGCVYMGGLFYHTEPGLYGAMIYNPGRTTGGFRPCEIIQTGEWCPGWDIPECSGSYPTACHEYLELTNLKISLANVGVMNWGQRARITKFEAHDVNGGPIAELFGDNSVTETIVTCETGNVMENFCDPSSAHEGEHGGGWCTWFDRRFWQSRRKVIQWYDTNMNTVFSNATIRSCDPMEWSHDCTHQCPSSSIFESLTHSNQFLPEMMSLTAAIKYENDANVRNHVINFNSPDTYAISGRTVGWIDVDGGVCGIPGWSGPTLLGSNHDAGEWWHLDEDCELIGSDVKLWCCQARKRLIASLYFKWDDALEQQIAPNGAQLCENGSGPTNSDCPRHGYLARFGQTNLVSEGLKVNQRPEIVGPVPEFNSATGFGWYLWLDQGAPVELKLNRLQIHHGTFLIVATPYPKGTSFTITMTKDWSYGCHWKYLCSVTYAPAPTLNKLIAGGPPTFFVDTSPANYDLLYVRVVQRNANRFSDSMFWNYGWKAPMFTDSYIDALPEPNFWGIPYRDESPTVTITANCASTGAYCSGGPMPQVIPPPLWG